MASKNTVSGTLVDDKGTWTVRGRVTNPITGKVRNKSKSTGYKVKDNTKRKAAQAMAEILAQWEKEANETLPDHDLTLRYYVEAWLRDKETTTRPNTVKSYRDYANLHILPALGNVSVRDITWRTLQRLYEGLLKTHKVVTVRKYDIVVSGALEDAVRDDVIPVNPAALVKWPKRTQPEARPFDPREAGQILAMAENAPEPMHSAIILGLCYGLRRSEVCGLRWLDIDFEQGTMHIRHTVTQNGKVLLDDDHTKTQKSNRTLALIPDTVSYFKQLRARHVQYGLPLDKVVAWPDGHNFRPDGITRMFKTLLKNNGLDPAIRFHDLRHMAASVLASSGEATPKQIQEFMGHDDISITYGVYVQSAKDSGKKTSAAMSKALAGLMETPAACSEICSELRFG